MLIQCRMALVAALVFVIAWQVRADSASDAYQKGVFAEETKGDLDGAMKIYQQIVSDSQTGRPIAAMAAYRLALCHGKKKENAESAAAFKQVIAQFPDQAEVVAKARESLAVLEPAGTAAAAGQNVTSAKPQIVQLDPPNGAKSVDAGKTSISVTFDQPMGGGMSWCGGGPAFPESGGGKPVWSADKKTCTMSVKLKAGWQYQLGVNCESFRNFKSAAGVSADPVNWGFSTGGTAAQVQAAPKTPVIVQTDPPNGSTAVEASKSSISITFDTAMGGGMSLCGGGPNFPEGTGKPAWSDDKKTWTLGVRLQPGHSYTMGINCPSFQNFRSADGLPVTPTTWNFSTK